MLGWGCLRRLDRPHLPRPALDSTHHGALRGRLSTSCSRVDRHIWISCQTGLVRLGYESGKRIPIIIPRLGDLSLVTADERDEHLMLLETARHQLDVEFTETLGVADGEGDYHLFGYPSTVGYLKGRLGIAGGRAHRYVKNARAAFQHRSTMWAWRHRQITTDQAELLFQASQRLPDRYPNAEVLLEICGDTAAETRQILDYWFNTVDQPGVTLELETQLARRHFEVTRKPNGMVEGDFALPTMAGETLLTAIDTLMPPPATDDERTTSQRRADALEDLAPQLPRRQGNTRSRWGETTHHRPRRPRRPPGQAGRAARDLGWTGRRSRLLTPACLRSFDHPGRLRTRLGGSRRETQDQGHPRRPPPGGHRPRPTLHLAGMPTICSMV